MGIISTSNYHCFLEGPRHRIAIPWTANLEQRLKPIYSGHPQEKLCKDLLMISENIKELKKEREATDIWSWLVRWFTRGKYVYIPEKCQCKPRPIYRHSLPPEKQPSRKRQAPQVKIEQTPAVVVPPTPKKKIDPKVIRQCTQDEFLRKRSADNAQAKQCIKECNGKSGAKLGNCTARFW